MSSLARLPALILILFVVPLAAALPRGGAAPARAGGDPTDVGRPSLRVFTDRDGLPQNAVAALAFDHDGYLWAGTKDGAARYDGRTWTPVTLPLGLHATAVQAIVVAADGAVWLGTNGGLARYANGGWTTFVDTPLGPVHEVTALLEAHSDAGALGMLVGTSKGLLRFENGEWRRELPVPEEPDVAVSALYEQTAPDGRRAVWVGTFLRGISRLVGGAWTRFEPGSGLPNTGATCFFETSVFDGAPALFGGCFGQGIVRFDGSAWVAFTPDSPDAVGGIVLSALETHAPDGAPTLWLATSAGLDRFERGRWLRVDKRNGFPSTAAWSLAAVESPAGTVALWAGTGGLGIVHWQLGGWTTFDKSVGMRGDSIYSLLTTTAEDGSPDVWIGTVDAALARLHRGAWTFYGRPEGLEESTVWCLAYAPDADGAPAIWAGTNVAGLFRFRDGRWTNYGVAEGLPGASVSAVCPTKAADGSPALWVATIDGLARLEHGRYTTDLPGLVVPEHRVRCLLETTAADGATTLWAGTEGGLARYERGATTTYALGSGLPGNGVTCLHVRTDAAGRRSLWVGTRAGIGILDLDGPRDAWRTLSTTSKPELPNDTVYRVEEDRAGRAYVFTNKGVARLTPREPTPDDPAAYSVYTFTTADGLPSNECNTGASTVDADGRVWAGTIRGAAVFDPSREVVDPTPRPLVVEHAALPSLGRALLPGESLPYDANHVTFDFALLSFFREGDTRYRTRLVGFDDEPGAWTADARRDYLSLPPGDYRLEVWARDAHGIVSGPVEMPFTILPAPWLTWWAFALYALALAYFVFVAFRLRVHSLGRRNAALEVTVAERTAVIARSVDELRDSERRASEANRAKSVFLANMSHELRTPLNAILGFVQLMERDRSLASTHQESLGIITRAGEHLLGLINDVLSIAKIEAGKETLVEQTFDLHGLVRSVCEMIRVRAEAKELLVELVLDPSVPVVMSGDEGKLRQVLVNLLGNAVKFTHEGSVGMRVRWEATSEDGGRATFEVTDTGAGIADEEIERLFTPFTQTESGRRANEGTGLGLVISRDFVRLMGGDLQVKSAPGSGTTFTFDVVLRVASHVDRRAETRRDPVGLAPDSPASRVLVADDVAENRLLLTRLLESVGFDARVATNGAEAVDLWASWRPDVIWMDMRMPVMDGLDATREIRRREAADPAGGAPTRIVALTASAFEHDRDRFLGAGCDDFVSKPFQTSTILAKMAQHAGARYLYDESETAAAAPSAEVTPERLGALAPTLRDALREALVAGDAESALDVATRVGETDAALAGDLAAAIRAYRFDDVLDAIDAAAA